MTHFYSCPERTNKTVSQPTEVLNNAWKGRLCKRIFSGMQSATSLNIKMSLNPTRWTFNSVYDIPVSQYPVPVQLHPQIWVSEKSAVRELQMCWSRRSKHSTPWRGWMRSEIWNDKVLLISKRILRAKTVTYIYKQCKIDLKQSTSLCPQNIYWCKLLKYVQLFCVSLWG